MTTDEKINADASVASRYLFALLNNGVERADAVNLTSSYMGLRVALESHRTATDLSTVRASGVRS